MSLIFHRLVQKDLRAVLRYYEEEGGSPLADQFFAELDALVSEILGANESSIPWHMVCVERICRGFLTTCFSERVQLVFAYWFFDTTSAIRVLGSVVHNLPQYSRYSQRRDLSRRVRSNEEPNGNYGIETRKLHAARQLPSWLTSDVAKTLRARS